MRVNVIHIGNSRGIRIPKAVLKQTGLNDEVDLRVEGDTIIIRPAKKIREGWEAAAKLCHLNNEDNLEEWDSTVADFEGNWV